MGRPRPSPRKHRAATSAGAAPSFHRVRRSRLVLCVFRCCMCREAFSFTRLSSSGDRAREIDATYKLRLIVGDAVFPSCPRAHTHTRTSTSLSSLA